MNKKKTKEKQKKITKKKKIPIKNKHTDCIAWHMFSAHTNYPQKR